MTPTPDSGSSHATGTPGGPRRRRYSVWTLLAPAAVAVLWIAFFASLSGSCIKDGCGSKDDSASEKTAAVDPAIANAKTIRITQGMTLGAIATKYGLTEDELKACNPDVDPQALTPGKALVVEQAKCKGADLAAAGANPDPLAGETNSATGAGADSAATAKAQATNNGTAAADPSVKEPEAQDATSTTSTKG